MFFRFSCFYTHAHVCMLYFLSERNENKIIETINIENLQHFKRTFLSQQCVSVFKCSALGQGYTTFYHPNIYWKKTVKFRANSQFCFPLKHFKSQMPGVGRYMTIFIQHKRREHESIGCTKKVHGEWRFHTFFTLNIFKNASIFWLCRHKIIHLYWRI